MILLINYADGSFKSSQKLNSKTAKNVGLFDKVISYTSSDIEPGFFNKNKKILSQKRGNGYWLWKPYFIKKSLELLNPGDFLFYCDSGSFFINPLTPLVDIVRNNEQDILPFELFDKIEKVWTKRDTFMLMDCDSPRFTDTNQRLGGFILMRKSKFTMDFSEEYLNYAQDERIIADLENRCGYPDYPEFKGHRHDQSIFSLLTKKYELGAYRDPSQWGNKVKELYPASNYDQLIELTRRKGSFFVL